MIYYRGHSGYVIHPLAAILEVSQFNSRSGCKPLECVAARTTLHCIVVQRNSLFHIQITIIYYKYNQLFHHICNTVYRYQSVFDLRRCMLVFPFITVVVKANEVSGCTLT